MLVTVRPMCIETSMTINFVWVKCSLSDVITPEYLLTISFIGLCCIVGAPGKPCCDYKTLQPSAGKTLALGVLPGDLLLFPKMKRKD